MVAITTDMEGKGSPAVLSLLGSVVHACVRHSDQALFLVVVCRSWDQWDRARAVTDSKRQGIQVPKLVLVVMQGPWTCILSFVCWTGLTCSDQRFGPVWYDHLGPIRDWLTFCVYPHVSMLSSSMLTAATRCQCLQIWIWEFVKLKQPVTAQLAILPPPYLCQNCSYPWEAITVSTDRYTLLFPDPVMGNHDCLWVSTSITVPTLGNHYCSYSWVTLTVLIHG